MSKTRERQGWILFLFSLFFLGYMLITNREFNIFSFILIGGGLGMGTMILSALSIIAGRATREGTEESRSGDRKVPKDPTLFRMGIGRLLNPVLHRSSSA